MRKRLEEINTAPVVRRFFAYLVDIIILIFIVFIPLGSTSSLQKSSIASFEVEEFSFLTIMLMLITIIIITLYWSLFEFLLQQTPGKMIMRIKVISETKQLTFLQCIIRNITRFSTLLLIIDCIPIFKKGKRFTEQISKTRVIKK
jgi:uncharacterized RDD family membrane protein YckC